MINYIMCLQDELQEKQQIKTSIIKYFEVYCDRHYDMFDMARFVYNEKYGKFALFSSNDDLNYIRKHYDAVCELKKEYGKSLDRFKDFAQDKKNKLSDAGKEIILDEIRNYHFLSHVCDEHAILFNLSFS